MSTFETGYRRLESCDEEESPNNDREVLVHVPEANKARWNHIENLDYFFTRIYHFHQKNGFACMMMAEFFELVQFLFVVTFTTFLVNCVDYDILFANKRPTDTPGRQDVPRKVRLEDAIFPEVQCRRRIEQNSWIIFLLVIAATFWIYRLVKVIYNFFCYLEIRSFYIYALHIPMSELPNYSWQEVQEKILAVQKDQQMCIHKRELTELDLHHRILRFKNYLVAMVNKSLLPLALPMPFMGSIIFLTQGLKYNLELLLFWGPDAPFQSAWSLRPEYKRSISRLELAERLSRNILWVGLANLALCPLVLVWQVLHAFFRYAEVLKREPGSLGARRWSLYGQLYLRHLNELDNELRARLSHGYKHATRYMDSFSSPALSVIAKNVTFFAGSLLAVLLVLTIYDEDVLSVEHVLTAITALGLLITVCRAFIPAEQHAWCPEQLLQAVLAHIHYMPENWKGQAHKAETRDEFSQVFQYKAVFILEELLSPIITPFILIFRLRPKALEIVDFFRNFTVEVVGVGDVCSFAQMDIRRHGNPTWMSSGHTEASCYQQAEDGKTELSLMHFAISNPRWRPPDDSTAFISQLRGHVQKDVTNSSTGHPTLLSSLQAIEEHSGPLSLLQSVLASHPYHSSYTHSLPDLSTTPATTEGLMSFSVPAPNTGSHWEGPLPLVGSGTLSTGMCRLHPVSVGDGRPHSGGSSLYGGAVHNSILSECASVEMSLHAIYIHEARRQLPTSDAHSQQQWFRKDFKDQQDQDMHDGHLSPSVVNIQAENLGYKPPDIGVSCTPGALVNSSNLLPDTWEATEPRQQTTCSDSYYRLCPSC
uniref:Autophagy-related protein 9 n=1 Tax=Eptatretus burgeri TaxID=7764 RepID=A0A8C4NC76_EPTBU